LGWGGQQIIVIPQKDMTVVFTAGLRNASWNSYDTFLDQFIIPAARSDSPLPANPASHQALQEQIKMITNPNPQTPVPLPAIVKEINDKTFVDLNGTHGWSTFSLHFDEPDEAYIDLTYGNASEQIFLPIGLDGVFRTTETNNYGPLAMKGYWKNSNTFVLTQQFLKEAERITMSMQFTETGIKRFSEWTVENYSEDSEAVLLNR
jgi:hypothetical protein